MPIFRAFFTSSLSCIMRRKNFYCFSTSPLINANAEYKYATAV
nr:MAG TPA: hypothetical protein [Bacteriophage sp.]